MKRYFSLSLIALFLTSVSACKKPENNDLQYLILGFLGTSAGDYYARLYYLDPLLAAAPTNSDLVIEATSDHAFPGTKKLILVHGWHADDRTPNALPSPMQLKDRILKQNWTDFISVSPDGFGDLVATYNWKIFAFDYLTSEPINENGIRLRQKLDAVFSGQTANVVIYGHSMGGITSRFAIYEDNQPAYVAKVVTTGAPFHGSPWASPEFQGDRGPIGAIASFVTDTEGGRDLRWDNHDDSLPGASNPKLTALNDQTGRDGLFYAFFGSTLYTDNLTTNDAASGDLLVAACPILGATFSPSDCIVPESSATLQPNLLPAATYDLGKIDHIDIKLGTPDVRLQFRTYIESLGL